MLEYSSGTSSAGMEGLGGKAVQVGHAEPPAHCAAALTATAGLEQSQTPWASCPIHSGESYRTWKECGVHLHQGPVPVLLRWHWLLLRSHLQGAVLWARWDEALKDQFGKLLPWVCYPQCHQKRERCWQSFLSQIRAFCDVEDSAPWVWRNLQGIRWP